MDISAEKTGRGFSWPERAFPLYKDIMGKDRVDRLSQTSLVRMVLDEGDGRCDKREVSGGR